jgi:hypothetical protein
MAQVAHGIAGGFSGETPNGARRFACRPRSGTGGEIDGEKELFQNIAGTMRAVKRP